MRSTLCLYCGTQVDHVIGVGGVHFFEVDGLSLTLEGEAGARPPCTDRLGWDGWHPLRRNTVESHAAVSGPPAGCAAIVQHAAIVCACSAPSAALLLVHIRRLVPPPGLPPTYLPSHARPLCAIHPRATSAATAAAPRSFRTEAGQRQAAWSAPFGFGTGSSIGGFAGTHDSAARATTARGSPSSPNRRSTGAHCQH